MADEKSGGLSGGAAVAIVALGIAAIVWLTTIVIDKYETAGDAVSVLSVVVGPLAGIAAAAFGVKLSIDAKKETKARTRWEQSRMMSGTSSPTWAVSGG